MIDRQKLVTIVGQIAYSAVFKQRAIKVLQANKEASKTRLAAKDDEAVLEITVWAEPDETDGGTVDVLTLDPWMWEFQLDVDIILPGGLPPKPGPKPEEKPPEEVDPCQGYEGAIQNLNVSIAYDQESVKLINKLIRQSQNSTEKKTLRLQKKKIQENIKHSKDKIKEIKQNCEP